MASALIQLQLEFEWGYSPKWLLDESGKQRKFDFRIGKIIIEMDGNYGHYSHGKYAKDKFKEKAEQCKQIDNWKDKQAEINGFSVIRIDADKSTFEYLKATIMSALKHIYNMNNIDWTSCACYALGNKVKGVCLFYENNKNMKISDIAKHFILHPDTIYKYLKQGEKLGWCSYHRRRKKQTV